MSNLTLLYAGNPGSDGRNGLIYGAPRRSRANQTFVTSTRDTFLIVRADFESRKVDTLSWYGVPKREIAVVTEDPNGKRVGSIKIDPFAPPPDEWITLSDGTLAVLRQQDYHVDWVMPEGARSSTAKLPFSWFRLTDDYKQARVDSVKKVIDSLSHTSRPYGMNIRGARQGGIKSDTLIPTVLFPKFDEMPTNLPPFRRGAVKADRDGNLWVLPSSSFESQNGLVYDVINRTKGLFERVRLPKNCVVLAFGNSGVLYLAANNPQDKTWSIVRARIN